MTPDYKKFAKTVMSDALDGCDWDGGDLQEIALECGILREVEGGYNPEVHGIHEYAQPGDPWLVFAE